MSGTAVRRLWISVGALFGLVLVAVALGLFLVYSEIGSRWLVERAKSRLPEGLTVQSFSGSVAGPFEVFGVEYVVGPVRIRVEKAQVYWRPWNLLDKNVQLDSVRVTGALVRLDTASAPALPDTASTPAQVTQPEATVDEGPPWRVTWEQLSVSGAVFEGLEGIRVYDAELASSGHLDSFSVTLRSLAVFDTLGEMNLRVAGRGSVEHLDFDELVLSRDSTRLVARGKVGWKPTVSWTVAAQITRLNPADWAQQFNRLTGQVDLAAESEGNFTDGVASVRLVLDTLAGTIADYPVTGRAAVQIHDDTIRVDSTYIEWGGLVARVQGVIADTVQLSWDAVLPDLSLWGASWGGRVRAEGKANGPMQALDVQARLAGARLRIDDYLADSVEADLDFKSGGALASNFRMIATGAQLSGRTFNSVELVANGTRSSHTLSAHVAGPANSGRAAVRGGYDSLWRGDLEVLEISVDSVGSWTLTQPAPVLIGPDTLAASGVTLESERGRLELQAASNFRDSWLFDCRLDSVPTEWLCELAALDFTFDSRLIGDVRLSSTDGASLSVEALLAASPGRLLVDALPKDTVVTDTIDLDLSWTPQGGQLSLDAGFILRGDHTPVAVTGRLPGTDAVMQLLRADSADWRSLGWSGTLDVKPLSLALLDPMLPDDARLDGEAALHLVIASAPRGVLLGECELECPPGRVFVWTGTDTLVLDWSASLLAVRADSTGLSAQAHSALSMSGNKVGALEFDLRSESPFVLGEDPLDLPLTGTMSAQVELAPLQPFVAGVSGLSGSFKVGATMVGSPRDLAVEGNLELTAEAFLQDLGIQLSQVRLSMNAAGGRTKVAGSAQSGGGTLELSGDISRLPTRESPSRLRVQGKDFLATDTRQAQVWITPDLELSMFGDSLDLSGRLEVPKANIEIMRLPEQAVAASSDVVIVGDTLAHEGPNLPFWSKVTLALGNKVFFKGFDVTAFLTGSIDIRQAPGADPEAKGEVVLREGRYRGMGQDLQIDPGRLVFSGPLLTPGIDVLAYRRASDHTKAGFKVSGRLPEPQVDLYSDPMKSDNDIMSYILFGRSSTEGSDSEQMKASEAAALVGGNLLAATAATKIGLDEARIDPGYTGDDAALVAGKYVSPQLFVGYGEGLFETLHTLRVRYILSTHFSLEAETGTRETADVIYQIERGE